MERSKRIEKYIFDGFPTLRRWRIENVVSGCGSEKDHDQFYTRIFAYSYGQSSSDPEKGDLENGAEYQGAAVWNGIGGNPDRRVLCVIGAVYTGDAACRIQGESCSGTGKEKCTGSSMWSFKIVKCSAFFRNNTEGKKKEFSMMILILK